MQISKKTKDNSLVVNLCSAHAQVVLYPYRYRSTLILFDKFKWTVIKIENKSQTNKSKRKWHKKQILCAWVCVCLLESKLESSGYIKLMKYPFHLTINSSSSYSQPFFISFTTAFHRTFHSQYVFVHNNFYFVLVFRLSPSLSRFVPL